MLATSKLDVQRCHREGRTNPLRSSKRDEIESTLLEQRHVFACNGQTSNQRWTTKSHVGLRRLVWDDGPPILLFSFSGIKYVLIRARVFHGLPIVSDEELKVLIAAIEDFTVTGKLWSYADWREALDRDFEIFGDSIRQDHPQTIEEEESEMLHTSRKGLEEQNDPRAGMTKEGYIVDTRNGSGNCRCGIAKSNQ